ncbi:tetratricopeptide repeat protein [Rufibacter psychrotolerans]|uniref:tetratricopeptide repeat protein n=1 Tax=Rufibacter psychrotolerans TaxID=2812556 RepID=UPI0019678579|nr:tetratricopeptide repeat protein [Rufibacter sp. SYSU D00308]
MKPALPFRNLFAKTGLLLGFLAPAPLFAQTTVPLLHAPKDTVVLTIKETRFKHTFKVSEAGREKLVRISPNNRPNFMHVNTGKDSLAVKYQNNQRERFRVTNGKDTISLVFSYFTPPAYSELNKKATEQYHKKNYQESINLYQQALAAEPKGAHVRNTYYNIACDYALMGQKEQALQNLEKAVAAGYKNLSNMRRDSDLEILKKDKRYLKLEKQLEKQQAHLGNPDNVQLVTTDVHNFWKAYDLAAKDPARQQEVFEKEYFAKASVGLQDYFEFKIGSLELFLNNLNNKTAFFPAIRKNTLQVDAMKADIYKSLHKMKELYPASTFPNVYFVIGRYNSAGTASDNGLLIGIDQFSKSDDVPLHELNLWERNNYNSVQNVPPLIAHELIHFIQTNKSDTTLLAGALTEGMADFIGELISGVNINKRLHTFGNPREKEIWEKFKAEMYLNRSKNWIANGGQERPDWPADLGYYMGYKICEAYYNKATDKKQAVKDILEIKDPKAFFEQSGYADKFTKI